MSIQELLQQREGLIVKQEAILNKMSEEKRNMTVDEKSIWDKIDLDIASIEESVERTKKFQERLSSLDSNYKEFNNFSSFKEKQGNKQNIEMSLGEMCLAAAAQTHARDRMHNAHEFLAKTAKINSAATGLSANVPSDGGFLISPTKSQEIMKLVYDGGQILNNCSVYEVGEYSESFEVPYLEETSRATGSRFGGVRAYREGETDAPTSSKPSLGNWECKVEDVKAHVYITERMLNDAPALESFVMGLLPQEFTFKLENEILNGTGGNQCKGIVGDAATVSVAKETGQVAETLLYENIVKMYSRMWGRSRPGASWYFNQDIEPQLFAMSLNVGTGGVPVFLPANGLSSSPYGTLFGRPLIPTEQSATLGTVGDILFADMSQYALVRKGGLKTASSIHVRFLYDEMVFKFNIRINGKPKLKSAITPFKGTNTLAPFVTLATRA